MDSEQPNRDKEELNRMNKVLWRKATTIAAIILFLGAIILIYFGYWLDDHAPNSWLGSILCFGGTFYFLLLYPLTSKVREWLDR